MLSHFGIKSTVTGQCAKSTVRLILNSSEDCIFVTTASLPVSTHYLVPTLV